jgi:3-hydroxyacyl-CoA dehydrogenase
MTYRDMKPVVYNSLEEAKKISDTGARIMSLYYASDTAGLFTFRSRSEEFIYSANRIPEIARDILTIDNALKWGFNRELGPFEMWDAVGLMRSKTLMEARGYSIPPWVKEMIERGFKTFYTENEGKKYHYDPLKGDYREARQRENL